MNNKPASLTEIFLQSKKETLYKQLLLQLNKDFARAGIDVVLQPNIAANDLTKQLVRIIDETIHHDFSTFLNLLYAIDVSEEKIKQLTTKDTTLYIEKVTYLIVFRQWQKVWMRNKYRSN